MVGALQRNWYRPGFTLAPAKYEQVANEIITKTGAERQKRPFEPHPGQYQLLKEKTYTHMNKATKPSPCLSLWLLGLKGNIHSHRQNI